ncbi:MAG: SPOR domain-containing protein [Sutterella wadsworthensis]|jgi:cell division septation protein DedD|uniref:SPOR domain-containing protein n=1 Tax=Sutterella sp. KLE1602 TaxID=1574262 RepID=UPI00078189A7|nr:SPOR domain-containing protein [Sutterella sp. KLE1602]MBS6614819.1 SPOR domain-containing protein [Sutterella wadsworthensis]KXT36885.1 sporulation and cell division repeat protein [Sutterella sp. KLE1602]MCI7116617.1 SPOR domain-containing protein [Sutterella wadsworthensis]MDY5223820.1 SPOR domain-containing protein [Sutterella wadsworthensis]MEE0162288.1 SPOR domain-containing protein [Sutterella wadsworthensis]
MQFPNPFKKEKPAEQAAEAPRIEPQLGGEGGEPSPWDVREDPPAFNVVGEEKPLVEPERAAEPVPESVQTPVYSPAAPAASADPVAPAPESAPRGSLFVEPKAPQPAAKIEPRLAPRAADAAPETRLVIGEIGSAPSPEAPRRPAPEPEAAAPAGDEEPTGKKRLRMPAFGFMKRKAAPLSDEVEDDVPDEEILVQRQRTRYRLVGAAALMLGVIVVSPLLLDREQDVKPPVSTEIPAVPETARTTLNALPGSSGDVDVTANGAAAEQSTSRANLANEARQPVKTEPAPKAEAAKPAPAPAARPEPKKAEEKPAKKSSATDGKGFYVQVLATSSERNAEKLVRELSAKGYPAYKVSVSQKAGTLWRVRVGNYATRDEARGVQGTLVLDGHTGQLIVGNNP